MTVMHYRILESEDFTVRGLLLLDDMWKKTRFSPAMMYDTPYPSSATGPNPPELIQECQSNDPKKS